MNLQGRAKTSFHLKTSVHRVFSLRSSCVPASTCAHSYARSLCQKRIGMEDCDFSIITGGRSRVQRKLRETSSYDSW